jgi:hypothetical protein
MAEKISGKVLRLRGDWMRDGYINNLGRPDRLEIAIVEGRAYVAPEGRPELRDPPLELDADDCIRHVGATGSGFFSPDTSEIERIGRNVFRSIRR